MLVTQLVEFLLIERAIIPQALHLSFKPAGIKTAKNIHQGILFLLILCTGKRFQYHHLRFIHRFNLHMP